MQRIRRDDDIRELFRHSLSRRRRLGGWSGAGRSGSSSSGRCFTTQYLGHHSAAGWALAFYGLAPVLHRFLDGVDNFLLGLAFDAVSFRHKKFAAATLHAPWQSLTVAYGVPVTNVNRERAKPISQSLRF